MSDRRIVEVMQCEAKTEAGHRCRKRTARSNYCWIHLAKLEDLRIKKSQIPDAGFGLYAAKTPIKADKKICLYEGKKIISKEPVSGPYVLQLSKDKYIDAASSKYVGGYSNMARTKDLPLRNNAKLTAVGGVARIKSTKNIKAGAEIFTSYARDYF